MLRIAVMPFLFCAAAAGAQSANPNDPAVIASNLGMTAALSPPTAELSPFALYPDITPTMRRQRIARAAKVAMAFPQLASQMQAMTPRQAAAAYRRAQRDVMWSRVNREHDTN